MGWKEEELGSVGECIRGVSYNPSTDLLAFDDQNSAILLRANNIVNNGINLNDIQRVRKECVSDKQFLLPGDIIIAMSSGSETAIGKTASFYGAGNKYCVGAFCSIYRSKYNFFIKHLFQSGSYRAQLLTNLEGTSINNLNKETINGLIFQFPSDKKELLAIAEVLSDIDDLASAQEALIAKKRDIKQGVMEELLTGRRRLPGFSGEWESKPLNQIVVIRKDQINPRYCDYVKCVELEHIEPKTGRIMGWKKSQEHNSLKYKFKSNDVLFSRLRPYLQKYSMPKFDGICSTEFWVFTAYNDTITNKFIYYLIQTEPFLILANSTCGTKMPRAEWSLMKEAQFTLPSDVAEQTAIAAVLTDMDDELDALAAKLAKTRLLKQGLMDELLTGHTRLPKPPGEDASHGEN